ncbi:hypothetical protein pb186bvf_018073 [Paramecium bursaria]
MNNPYDCLSKGKTSMKQELFVIQNLILNENLILQRFLFIQYIKISTHEILFND